MRALCLAAMVAVLLLAAPAAAHPWHRHDPEPPDPPPAHAVREPDAAVSLLGLGAAVVVLAALALALRRRALVPVVAGAAALAAGLGCLGPPPEPDEPATEPVVFDEGTPMTARHFAPFKDRLQLRHDERYLYVGSDAFPTHPMMVGIRAWQQQVPLPQPYTGDNAWRIPLAPRLADKPVSARTGLFRGAIALAVNGVPIFNPLNNRREDAFLAGELDEYGGHCGRGDDYHYHIAPLHLEKVVGKGNPIGYALDGFPLYGTTDADGKEPTDLDEYNGRTEKDGYRYYSTRKYPYVNGGLRGVVAVRDGQIDPQPRDAPVRPAGTPLRGARVTAFERDDEKKAYTLKYDLRGETHAVAYTIRGDGTYRFVFTDGRGRETTETYRRRGKGPGKK